MGINHKYQILLVTTRKVWSDKFWSQEPGKIWGDICMFRKVIGVAKG